MTLPNVRTTGYLRRNANVNGCSHVETTDSSNKNITPPLTAPVRRTRIQQKRRRQASFSLAPLVEQSGEVMSTSHARRIPTDCVRLARHSAWDVSQIVPFPDRPGRRVRVGAFRPGTSN